MAATMSDRQKEAGSTARNGNIDHTDGFVKNQGISLAETLIDGLIEIRTKTEEPIQMSRAYIDQCILARVPGRPESKVKAPQSQRDSTGVEQKTE